MVCGGGALPADAAAVLGAVAGRAVVLDMYGPAEACGAAVVGGVPAPGTEIRCVRAGVKHKCGCWAAELGHCGLGGCAHTWHQIMVWGG
eukprot:268999-Chlamydomonas_euryale.AAC.1